MTAYQTIILEKKSNNSTIWLNRPEKRNAFNDQMIGEIIEAIIELNKDEQQRLIIMRGKGQSFSSGADLEMMRDITDSGKERRVGKENQLPVCLSTIYRSGIPVIAIAHGSVYGGAIGILAACDIALADVNTIFAFSEVKFGLIPAIISPYVIKRIGEFKAKDFMLSGRRLTALEAESSGLINKVLAPQLLEKYLEELINNILEGSPEAIKKCKSLIDKVSNEWTFNEALVETEKWIREIRGTEEVQKRINFFLNKKNSADKKI